MDVTAGDVHDPKALPKLLVGGSECGGVSKAYMDSSYDLPAIHELLETKGVEAIVKPRRNSRLNTRSEARRRAISAYKSPRP